MFLSNEFENYYILKKIWKTTFTSLSKAFKETDVLRILWKSEPKRAILCDNEK